MSYNWIQQSFLVTAALAMSGCVTPDETNSDENAVATGGAWQSFSTSAKRLTVTASEPLLVNSPFFGIEVRKNGVDVTDDIVDIETLSSTAWRYTFATTSLDTAGDVIEVSLDNRKLAVPGHYIAVRGGNDPVRDMYKLIVDCEQGKGACAGDAPLPGLRAAVKGLSRRYMPRDLELAPGVYDFSPVLDDAAFLASVGMKLHVIFTVKSFAGEQLFDGTGSRTSFPVPAAWDKQRSREIHVYVNGKDVPYQFSSDRTQVVLATAPALGKANVAVAYARDPFPEYAWQMKPPIGGWYEGVGGPHTGKKNGTHGLVHAPWRSTCVEWMGDFMAGFRREWTEAIEQKPSLAFAIESISTQETANALGGPGYSESTYRAGLLEYAKFNARAVRRRAIHGLLLNQIPGGNATNALQKHALSIIPWGARLEGPDLFNDEVTLENLVYQKVHRELHAKALTMIWQQNASYAEDDGAGGFYTPAEQFDKAKRGVTDTGTASGKPGLEAEYVFWNMTFDQGSGQDWKDALPVIAANPQIQSTGTHRHRWRRAANYAALGPQLLRQVNP